jgi:hypothetical protein
MVRAEPSRVSEIDIASNWPLEAGVLVQDLGMSETWGLEP